MQRDTKGRTIIQNCRKEVTHHRATCCDDHVPRTGSPYNIVKSRNYNQCQASLNGIEISSGNWFINYSISSSNYFHLLSYYYSLLLSRDYEYLGQIWAKIIGKRITAIIVWHCEDIAQHGLNRSNRGSKLTPSRSLQLCKRMICGDFNYRQT